MSKNRRRERKELAGFVLYIKELELGGGFESHLLST